MTRLSAGEPADTGCEERKESKGPVEYLAPGAAKEEKTKEHGRLPARPRVVLFLVELADRDEFVESAERIFGIFAARLEAQAAAGTGREHHEPHDTLAVDAFPVLLDDDLTLEFAGDADKKRRWPGMNAQPIHHDEITGKHSGMIRVQYHHP